MWIQSTLSPILGHRKGTKTVAILKDNGIDGFDIDIVQDATKNSLRNQTRI